MNPDLVRVGDVADFPDRTPVAVPTDEEDAVVVRIDGVFYALENLCTHSFAALDEGTLHARSLEIECPLHEGRFDLRSGAATAPPCVDPVRTFSVEVDGDVVYLKPAESPPL
jgi:nitrite reductase/ring-hydroxylating ferredoxin subunit